MMPSKLSPDPSSVDRFPLQPVALRILGDAVLGATLLRVSSLPIETAVGALILAFALNFLTSGVAGATLVRAGRQDLWDITSVACLAAMGVLLLLNGSILFAAMLGVLAWSRWRRAAAHV